MRITELHDEYVVVDANHPLAGETLNFQVRVLRVRTADEFTAALREAKAATESVVVHVETDPLVPAPDSRSWWDVPVAEVSSLESTQRARKTYDDAKSTQQNFLHPSEEVSS